MPALEINLLKVPWNWPLLKGHPLCEESSRMTPGTRERDSMDSSPHFGGALGQEAGWGWVLTKASCLPAVRPAMGTASLPLGVQPPGRVRRPAGRAGAGSALHSTHLRRQDWPGDGRGARLTPHCLPQESAPGSSSHSSASNSQMSGIQESKQTH